MKRYLITGFSGFVSYFFLKRLNDFASEKIQILGFDLREPEKWKLDYAFKNLEIKFVPLNLLDARTLEEKIAQFSPDYILHLAAISSVGASWKAPADCFANNTNVFLNIVEAVRKNNIKCRILSVGSSEEYGNVSMNEIPLVETLPLKPGSPYAIARVSQEMLSKCYVSSFGLDIIMTRSFNHIGPRQKECFVAPSFVKQIVFGSLELQSEIQMTTGDTSIVRDFLDVRDVVRAYDLLFLKGKTGEVYNICYGCGHALSEIISTVADKMGVKVTVSVDQSLVRPQDNMIVVGDNSKIFNQIGWRPEFSFEDTLEDMIEYWKGQYALNKNK